MDYQMAKMAQNMGVQTEVAAAVVGSLSAAATSQEQMVQGVVDRARTLHERIVNLAEWRDNLHARLDMIERMIADLEANQGTVASLAAEMENILPLGSPTAVHSFKAAR